MSDPEECCWNCNEGLSECECGETETYDNYDGPLCPYCGHLNKASDSDGLLYDESTTEYDCGDCGKEFDVSVNISFSWNGYRKENK